MALLSPNVDNSTRTDDLEEEIQSRIELTAPPMSRPDFRSGEVLDVLLSKMFDMESRLTQGQSSLESRLTMGQLGLAQGTATVLNEMSQRLESL